MRILITNDDGIYATGLRVLAATLSTSDEVTVVASHDERSTSGHAITRHKPLRVNPTVIAEASSVNAWITTGTPADNAKLGVELLLTQRPDLLLSGINRGSNLGRDVYYSGTVSAAMEGMFLGVPSIALSLDVGDSGSPRDFLWCAQFVRWWIHSPDFVLPRPEIFYNVNFPRWIENSPQSLLVVGLGRREYENRFIRRQDPQGREYLWFIGRPKSFALDTSTDVGALDAGYITLTPIQMDVTAHDVMDSLSDVPVPNQLAHPNTDEYCEPPIPS
jgi:5'-nucleotidase